MKLLISYINSITSLSSLGLKSVKTKLFLLIIYVSSILRPSLSVISKSLGIFIVSFLFSYLIFLFFEYISISFFSTFTNKKLLSFNSFNIIVDDEFISINCISLYSYII